MDIAFLDATSFVACSQDGVIRAWELGKPNTAEFPESLPSEAYATLIVDDGQALLGIGRTILANRTSVHSIGKWDIRQRKEIWMRSMPYMNQPYVAVFNSIGTEIITPSEDGKIFRWTTSDGDMIGEHKIFEPGSLIKSIAISEDRQFLALCETVAPNPIASRSLNREIAIFDLTQKTVIHRWKAHDRVVGCAAFGPNKDELLTAGWDKVVRRWKISTQEMLAELRMGGKNSTGLFVVNDGRLFVAVDSDGTIWRWRSSDNKPLDPIVQKAGSARIPGLSPRGHTLAIPFGSSGVNAHQGQIKLFDTRTWELKATFLTGPSSPSHVNFSSDGTIMTSGNGLGKMFVWHGPRK